MITAQESTGEKPSSDLSPHFRQGSVELQQLDAMIDSFGLRELLYAMVRSCYGRSERFGEQKRLKSIGMVAQGN